MKETLKYLRSDLEARSEVIRKYGDTVSRSYGIDITEVRTVPSLAMRVFKTVFLGEVRHKIPYLSGKVDKDIRNGYYGGIVAAIKPKVEDGYYYDVNSAYPAAMMKDRPVGNPVLTKIDTREGTFGFVHAEVQAPESTPNSVRPRPMRDENGISRFQFGMKSTG